MEHGVDEAAEETGVMRISREAHGTGGAACNMPWRIVCPAGDAHFRGTWKHPALRTT
jgi:hypothetical protein